MCVKLVAEMQIVWLISSGHIFILFFPGSPAEFSQLQVDDEILSLNGIKVSSMDYNQWREEMDNALETGNLAIDVRRYGKNGEFCQQCLYCC